MAQSQLLQQPVNKLTASQQADWTQLVAQSLLLIAALPVLSMLLCVRKLGDTSLMNAVIFKCLVTISHHPIWPSPTFLNFHQHKKTQGAVS